MQVRRLIVFLVLIGLLIAASFLEPVHHAIGEALGWAEQVIREHERLGLVFFCLLSAVSAIAFFMSTAVLVPVAVYTWGAPLTIALLWSSWMVGAACSYVLGRLPGRRVVRWLAPSQRAREYEKKLSAKASFPLVLLFQLAVPSEIPGYVLGALRCPFGRYIGARAIAELPFAVGAVYLGDAFVRRQHAPMIAIAVGGLLLSTLALYWLHRRLDRSG